MFSLAPALAQQTSSVQTIMIPNHAGAFYVEEQGLIQLTAGADTLQKRYVLRYPEQAVQWNGRLVIGAHSGIMKAYYRLGWDEAEMMMDAVIGDEAVDKGYACASMDLSGTGSARAGLEVATVFTRYVHQRLQAVQQRKVERTYLVGLSKGGAIARCAAEDLKPFYDGVIIVAGDGGDLPTWLERQAQMADLWTQIDPQKNPNLPDSDRRVKAYANAVGTPVEARQFWPNMGTSSLDNLRRSLAEHGLTDLSTEQLKQFRIKDYRTNQAFMGKLTASASTGQVMVPTIEVVGTYDDIVLREVLAYREKVIRASRGTQQPIPAEQYRLYQIRGVWHISEDDYFYYEKGRSYMPTVHETLAQLDRWVTERVAPPKDRIVVPTEPKRKQFDEVRKALNDKFVVLAGRSLTEEAKRVLQDARAEANRRQQSSVGTEHLLLAMIRADDSPMATVLRNLGMNLDEARKALARTKSMDSTIPVAQFRSIIGMRWRITTGKPIDGTRQHDGKIKRVSLTEVELTVGDTTRVIPSHQILGDVTIITENGAQYPVPMGELYWFKWPFQVTTAQPIEEEREHTGKLRQISGEGIELDLTGKSRFIPFEQIETLAVLFPRQAGREAYWGSEATQVLKVAAREADERRSPSVGVEHLLLALVKVHKGGAATVLDHYEVSYEKTRTALK